MAKKNWRSRKLNSGNQGNKETAELMWMQMAMNVCAHVPVCVCVMNNELSQTSLLLHLVG